MRNRKGLAVLMRTRMRATPSTATANHSEKSQFHGEETSISPNSQEIITNNQRMSSSSSSSKEVMEWMRSSISTPTDKTESLDSNLQNFIQNYLVLPQEHREELLVALAKDYDVNRQRVRELMQQYLNLDLPHDGAGDADSGGAEHEGALAALYRTERNLRDAIKPNYAVLFERLNAYPGGLKLLAVLRADLLSLLVKNHMPPLRALESYLKEKLITWLSPAALELHQITWDDSASLLEKIVAYEAVHPIRSLLDLKRRLSVGRRCFGYLHPAIPGEPLIFIEVALLKDIARSIQEVLWDDPPTPEHAATCALFYSISSTQPGLSGINLGKFLIKRVIELARRDMPHVSVFATLSPIPGYMQWLLSKLASQIKLAEMDTSSMEDLSEKVSSSTFKENILLAEEEQMIFDAIGEGIGEKTAMEILYNFLTSSHGEWTKSEHLLSALQPPLLRLGARYLLQEKKRGKALDAVANFHLQNGAIIERINWMGDNSDKGIHQSGGIMVNYVYRLDKIEENAQSYFSTGHIHASSSLHQYLEGRFA